MKRRIQVFIEPVIDSGDYLQLELFNDEQIVVNSSVQNISDISKVFTDFSQSFTVPASAINNAIFKHFYQSDIGDIQAPFAGLVDHNLRRKAYIEIDLTPFRRGKISLEKSNIKNGQAESYTITFYGDIRALKDAFGEQKLSDLDLSSLQFEYDGTEILNRITDLATDYDVRYPLISSKRLWTYGDLGTNDITTVLGRLRFDELFPAVKISKIFEAIEAQYGLTFTGTFLDDPKFTNVFLYCKNTNEWYFVTETQDVDFSNIITNFMGGLNPYNASSFVDLGANSINVQSLNDVTFHTITVNVISLSGIGEYYIDVFQNGNYNQTLQASNIGTAGIIQIENTQGLNSTYTFKVKSSIPTTIDFSITYSIRGVFEDPITLQQSQFINYTIIGTNSNILTGNININSVLPEMKVADFFTGVLKQFNATCVGVSENVFEVLPLDEWYAKGALVDVTEYTNIDSIDVAQIKLYKKISFKYQQSESFLNKQFFTIANREFGDLDYQFNYDGEEYIIQAPFENLNFAEFTGSGVYASFTLNTSFDPYTPKPVLLYLYGQGTSSTDIKFFDDTTTQNISNYVIFGQDFTYQNTKFSLNFGAEISIIHEETIQNGLFATYYFPYLSNLFNLKNRLISVKTNLPISLLTGLRINDRIIIRDKRYIINEMKSNLTTGDVDFTLYLDFRPVSGGLLNGGKPIELDESAQCVDVRVDLPNGAIQADLTCVTAGVTITPSTLTADGVVEICVPANPNTRTQLITEDSFDFITEEFENIITEESQTQVITVVVTYTFWNGTQAGNLIILQI